MTIQNSIATQKLKLADNLFAGLRDGSKRCTIRAGYRDIRPGFLEFESASGSVDPYTVLVTEVRLKTAEFMTDEEANADGFLSVIELFEGLLHYYPDITPDSGVTIIFFE
jgi:hypothetical protein